MVDINVGMLSEAINDKADRDLNNTQPLARTVIKTFVDGTSGYRIWSDGYCEQWGNAHVSNPTDNFTVSFLKKFKDNNYIVIGTTVPPINYSGYSGGTSFKDVSCMTFTISNKTVNSFKIQSIWPPDTTNGLTGDKQWKASGYLAEGEY